MIVIQPACYRVTSRKGVEYERYFSEGAHEVADRIAALGPVPRRDVAGGFAVPEMSDAIVLPLSGGHYALIDAEDYPLVQARKWSGHLKYVRAINPDGGVLFLHRVVMMLNDPARHVDHINHDTRDNRKSNLRCCSHMENVWNQKLTKANTSGVNGVRLEKGIWRGIIAANGVRYAKSFPCMSDAESWVRAKREELHGEFARHA